MNTVLSSFETEFLANLTRYDFKKIYRTLNGHLYAADNSGGVELIFDHLFTQCNCGYIISIDDLFDGNIGTQEKYI